MRGKRSRISRPTASRSKRPRAPSPIGGRSLFQIPNIRSAKSGSIYSAFPIVAIWWWSAIPSAAKTRVSSVHGAQIRVNEDNMKKVRKVQRKKQAVPDIDFSGGIRGKHAARFAEGTNLVALSPDVAEIFPDSTSVNAALRKFARMSGKTVRASKSSRRTAG